MDRRKFISTLIGGVAASAAVRTFPFRVFSFPSEIALPDPNYVRLFDPIPHYGRGTALTLEMIQENIAMQELRRFANGFRDYCEQLLTEERDRITESTSPPQFQSPTAPNCSKE